MASNPKGLSHTGANEMSEAAAIVLAREGDGHAFERLYRLHCRQVFSVCLRMTRSHSEAEDLTQETFLQVFRKIRTFRGESTFATWLYRLTFNVVLMRHRKKRLVEVPLDPPDADQAIAPRPELGHRDLRLGGVIDHINLRKAIGQLPRGYREIFLLHDVEGYEHREIAAIRGCTIGNSKSQLFKARFQLRVLLREVVRSGAREKRNLSRVPLQAALQD